GAGRESCSNILFSMPPKQRKQPRRVSPSAVQPWEADWDLSRVGPEVVAVLRAASNMDRIKTLTSLLEEGSIVRAPSSLHPSGSVEYGVVSGSHSQQLMTTGQSQSHHPSPSPAPSVNPAIEQSILGKRPDPPSPASIRSLPRPSTSMEVDPIPTPQ